MTFHQLFKPSHSSQRSSTYADDRVSKSRAGIITFWAIISIPIFLCVLCVVLEIGNLWLARIQLKNALESAALAGVKHWGDKGGGDTQASRVVGNAFASSLLINGVPVNLSSIDPTLNYKGFNSSTNQNTSCTGLFVFGSITDDSPAYVFDPCDPGGCGISIFDVVFDVSQSGNLGGTPGGNPNQGGNNQWGISLAPTLQTPVGAYVSRVVIRLPDTFSGGNPVFDFVSDSPDFSVSIVDNDVKNKVTCSSTDLTCGVGGSFGDSQADIYGVDVDPSFFKFLSTTDYGPIGMTGRLECTATGTVIAPGNQIGKVLLIEFDDPCVAPGCQSFGAGDRIRFGSLVTDNGSSNYDGDDIGMMEAEVTLCFNDGSFTTGKFKDTVDSLPGQTKCSDVTFPSWGQCYPEGEAVPVGNIDFVTGGGFSLGRRGMTFPTIAHDQPTPPNNGGGSGNGQSVVDFSNSNGSGAGLGFAVRAQASYDVPSICKNVFGLPVGPFCVTAKADALYECSMDSLRIYHLDDANYLCTNPLLCP